MNEHEKAVLAQRRVEAITGFYIHLVVFVVVMALLLAVNVQTGSDWWVQWPLMGWGIGVIAHAFAVFAGMPGFVTRWQLRKIKEIKDSM
jgi:hypothetical protein